MLRNESLLVRSSVASPAAKRKLRRTARHSFRTTMLPGIELLERRALLSTLSFWGDSTTPAIPSKTDDTGAYELGLKFYSDVPGNVVGIRFYKGDQQATHTVSLWDPLSPSPSVSLISATSASETSAGWQQVNFSTPYAIAAGSSYIASYYVPAGRYACDLGYFVGSGVSNGPLHAPYDGHSPSMLAITASRPNIATSANFWVDVVFEPDTAQSPPWVSSQSPAPNATAVATNASVSGTFTEPVDPDTIAFELRDSSNAIVPGVFDYDSNTNTVTLTPTSPLASSSTYTAMISGATDLAGNAMTNPASWSFKTVAVDTTPPAVTAQSPAPGAANVSTSPSVSATFSEDVVASSINFELRDAGNGLIPSTFSYNPATRVVTLVPAGSLSSNSTYTATVSGARDLASNVMGSPVSWSFTTAAPFSGTISLWDDATVPAVGSFNDPNPMELGVKFRSSTAGYITGLRFYKGAQNIGEHIGHLWSSAGASLATATFVNETTSGWQTVMLSSPVEISADTTYVASYHTNVGYYAVNSGYFGGSGFSNGPLTALKNGADGGNGVFAAGSASSFPTSSFNSANYWVDVIFTTSVTPVGPDITPATTNEDTQSTSGLVITPNPADSFGVTHFKITGITHGTLYRSDGVTPISDGDFITLADAAAGLKFTPAPNFFGTAGFGAQAAKSNSDSALKGLITPASITVNPVNDAPVLSGSNNLATIDEDATTNPGTLVSDLIAGQITDADGGAVQGIAITAADNAHGTWQYTIDGGSTWTNFGNPSASAARLLMADASTRVRFVPHADWNGTITDGLTFQAWDQSSGTAAATADVSSNGGITAFSSATASASITVNAVNDAPSFTKGADQTVLEDAGAQSIDNWATAISAGAANEADQALTFQLTTNNDALFAVLPAIDSSGKLTYTPAANAHGMAIVTVRLNDNGGTDRGGMDTSAEQTFTITVTSVNDAPVLSGSNNLATIDEDSSSNPGMLVADLVAGMITDVDSGAVQGIAITAIDTAHGAWQYTTDGGSNWTAIAGVADATALLLPSDANTRMRFVPDPDWNGTVNSGLTFRAWDQSTGMAGTKADASTNGTPTAFSSATASASITVNAVNDAPSFIKGADQTILEDAGAQSINGWATAISAGPANEAGQALTFQITTNNDALFAVLPALDASGKLTYTPAANANGTASVTVKLKDDGGTNLGGVDTSAEQTFTITITPVNDAPVLVGTADLAAIDEDANANNGTLVSDLIAGQITDADSGAVQGIAITAADNAHGTWQYTTDGGSTWTSFGTPSASAARLLSADASTRVRFVPAPDWNGTVSDGLAFQAWDQSSGTAAATADVSSNGGTTAFSNATASASITVNPVNDAPVAKDDVFSIVGNTPFTAQAPSLLANDADVESDPLTAILVTDVLHGTLVFSADGAFTYTPTNNYSGIDSFTYQVSDGKVTSNIATVTIEVNCVRHAPSAVNDSYSTDEDTPLNIAAPGVLANDTDVDGDKLSAIVDAQPTHGTLALHADGSFAYTPIANYHGTDSFTYKVSDGSLLSNSATVTITVNAVNDAPVAGNDSRTTAEDTPLQFLASDLLANDSDVDGDPLTVTAVGSASHGVVQLASGMITYTPSPNYYGPDSFSYTIKDPSGATATGQVGITVTSINDAPVANDDNYSTNEDTPLTIAIPGVLGNDTDVDGDPLTAILGVGPTHGKLTLNANGSFTYTPDVNYNGSDSFTYKISDGALASNLATVKITIAPVNDAPSAANDNYSTNEDTPLTIPVAGVLSNDSDVDGNALTAVLGNGPAHGTLILNANGSFTYTPSANYNGTDSFTYKASDGSLPSNLATVTIVIAAVNDPPVAMNDSVSTAEDMPLELPASALLANDTDVDGDVLSLVSASAASHGGVQVVGSKVIYSPSPNYFGNDSFTYSISDGHGGTASATVSVQITPVNDDPTAVNDAYTVDEDSGASALPVLANDTTANPDPGEVLTIVAVNQASHGTVAITGGGTGLTYTPGPDFFGTDTFTYTIEDGSGSGKRVTATVTITVRNINDAPVARNDSFSTDEDTRLSVPGLGVLANDNDVDGDVLSAVLVSPPSHGSLTLNANGSFTYQPASNYNGPDSFTYKASDGQLPSAAATVSLTINPVNDPPVARDDAKTAWEDIPLQLWASDLLINDSDADADWLTVTSVGPAAHGTVQLKDGQIIYQPAANYSGADRFTYSVNDGHGGIASASVNLQVNPVNDPPVAVDDYFTINEDSGMASFLILANDNAANPDPGEVLTIASVSQPAHGTVAIINHASAVLQYTPAADFFGTEVLSYTVKDPSGLTAVGKVAIVVRNVNDPPVANDDSRIVAENATLEFSASSLLANDTDVDGDLLTVKTVGLASHGTVVLKDGKITYTPEKNFYGTDRFSYTVSDPSGGTSTAQVNLTVAEVIENPLVGDDFRLGTEDTVLTIPSADLLANDADPNGYPLSIVGAASTAQTRGTVQLAGGQVIFTPVKDFNGITSFTYTVSDGHGGMATGIVAVQVNAVNDPPVLGPIPGPLSTDEGKAIGFQATASDVEGDQLTFSLVDAPWGATIDPATGAFTWTPGYDQAGTYSFFVRVTDDGSPILSDTKAVTINVKDVPIVTPTLQVRGVTPTPSGFDVQFNMPIDLSKLNLYDGVQTKGQPADLTIVGAGAGAVSGSTIWEPASNTLHFVKTGGVLAADTYTLTLFSRADGFVDLDGDSDGQAGGNYVKTVTVAPESGPIVSLPDIARGPKQSFTLPIRINEAAEVLSLRGELQFDPKLLNVSEIAGLAPGWAVTTQVLAEGRIQFTAYATAALSGAKDLLQVKATVPAGAAYGAAGILKLADLKINDKPAVGDLAVHAVAYLGDASGNQRYGGLDAALISNVTVGTCRGFDAYPLIDPLLIGDVSGNGSLGGLDAAYVAQKSIGMNVPQIPDLPATASLAPLAMKTQSGAGTIFAQAPIPLELPAEGVLSRQSGGAADSLPFGLRSIDEQVFG